MGITTTKFNTKRISAFQMYTNNLKYVLGRLPINFINMGSLLNAVKVYREKKRN